MPKPACDDLFRPSATILSAADPRRSQAQNGDGRQRQARDGDERAGTVSSHYRAPQFGHRNSVAVLSVVMMREHAAHSLRSRPRKRLAFRSTSSAR